MIGNLFINTFPGLLSIRDRQYRIIYLNENFRSWIRQYSDIDPIGKTNEEIAKVVPENVGDVFLACHDASIEWEKSCGPQDSLAKIIEFKSSTNKKEDSEYFQVLKYGIRINEEPHIFTVGYNITDIYKKSLQYLEASITDPLTGVYNRQYLIKNNRKHTGQFATLLDLDHFKLVNDTEGHEMGDKVLCKFVDLLKESLSNDTVIIRLGGDEFLLIFPFYYNQCEITNKITDIQSDFEKIFHKYPYLSFSFGLSIMNDNFSETTKQMDQSMYDQKKRKKLSRNTGYLFR